jgi:dephospho-CoA kinase
MAIFVGITGPISSGKSLVASILRNMGYKVFDADALVRKLYERPEIQDKVLSLFPEIQKIDKTYISEQIYQNKDKRLKLNNIFHPIVRVELLKYLDKNKIFDIVFADIPLLYEANFAQYFAYVICTYASHDVRSKRFAIRVNNQKAIKLFNQINEAQLHALKKLAMSNFVIYTSVTKYELVVQLKAILEEINNDRNSFRP